MEAVAGAGALALAVTVAVASAGAVAAAIAAVDPQQREIIKSYLHHYCQKWLWKPENGHIKQKFLQFYVLQKLFSKDFHQMLMEIKAPHKKENKKNSRVSQKKNQIVKFQAPPAIFGSMSSIKPL